MSSRRSGARWFALAAAALLCVVLLGGPLENAAAQAKPEGEMRWALCVTLSPMCAGAYAYGGYPDIDALYKEQALVTDRRKREVMLHQIQQLLHERVRFAPIWEYIWPSGVGPRVEEPALMLINPYPWSAPLEEVRLKKK